LTAEAAKVTPSPDPGDTRVRYSILLLLCLAAAISYAPRNSISVAETQIRGELSIPKTLSGAVISAFFISYAVFQIPAGMLVQRYGARRALATSAVLWSLAAAGFVVARDFYSLVGLRLLMGAAQAILFPAATQSIARWFAAEGRAFPNGALGSAMSAGGAAATALGGFLVALWGWRTMFYLYALPGFAWVVWMLHVFRDDPNLHPGTSQTERNLVRSGEPPSTRSLGQAPAIPWLAICTSPAMFWICAQHAFRAAGYIFFASWYATYLKESQHVSDEVAGLLNSLPVWCVIPGGLLGGAVSDYLRRRYSSRRVSRQGLAVVSLLGCCGCVLLAYTLEGAWSTVVISVGAFLAAMSGPCAYTITIDMGGRHVALVFSVMNAAGGVGTIAFPLAVPWIQQAVGWNGVLLAFALIYLCGAACWLVLDPRGTVFDQALLGRSAESNNR
jgi:MFS family permease